jgi:hypothetical protein
MTDKKISELTSITGAVLSDTDLIPVVDVSVSETKKITFAEFKNALDTSTGFVRLTGDTMTGTLIVPSLTANGNITVTGTIDGRDVSVDGTKLDGIEVGADVTDTDSVTAAGALMDSELTNLTAVKAINQGLATTDSPSFAGISATTATISGGTVNGTSVGATTASTGAFTTLTSTGGAINGTVGATTASTGAFTTLSASSTVSGTGFSDYLASPPAIGSTTASTGAFTTLTVPAGSQGSPSIYATGDTNTGIFFPAADTIAFTEGGVEAMRITNAGTLSIGTTAADQFITINSANTNTNALISYKQGGTTYAYTGLGGDNKMRLQGVGVSVGMEATTAQPIFFSISGSTRMTISSAGVVTIANLAGSGSRAVSANPAGDLVITSDSRLKQEVPTAPIPGLAEVMRLEPKAYKWLDDIENRGDNAAVEIGFFADQVNPISPLPGRQPPPLRPP